MKTTAIVAEILAVGSQALIWMALAAYLAFEPNLECWKWEPIGKWAAAVTIFLVMLAYSVGVVIDRVADTLVGWIGRPLLSLLTLGSDLLKTALFAPKSLPTRLETHRKRLGKLVKKKKREIRKEIEREQEGKKPKPKRSKFAEKRLWVRQKGGDMGAFLEYVRSRLRIARATVLNIALITLFAYFVVEQRETGAGRYVLFAGTAACVIALGAWMRIYAVYGSWLRQAFDILKKDGKIPR